MDRVRTRSMANTPMTASELSESCEDLKNKYESLWEQVDTLYKDGITIKQVETTMEKMVGQFNGRVDMLNTKAHDRIEVISNKLNDIVENEIGTLIKHERSNYNQIRGIVDMLDENTSERNDLLHFQINLIQNDNKRNKAQIRWMFYTNLVMFIIILYKFYN